MSKDKYVYMLRIFITYLLSLPLWSSDIVEEVVFLYKVDPSQEKNYCVENPVVCEKLKHNPYDLSHLEFTPERRPASKWMWATFTTLQLLDVYSTERGMRYDCVKELNPLLPKRPEVEEMLLLKFAILYPTYSTIDKAVTITNKDLLTPSLITAAVVSNNYSVNKRASKYCRKIR